MLQNGKIGKGMVKASGKTADDHKLGGTAGKSHLHRKLRVGQILFGRDLIDFGTVGKIFFAERVKIPQQKIGLGAKRLRVVSAAVCGDDKVALFGAIGDIGGVDLATRVQKCAHYFLLHSCLFFRASNIAT